MTAPRVRCAAADLWGDRHMAVGRWYQVTDPEGRVFDFCSGACFVEYATLGALPAPSTSSGQARGPGCDGSRSGSMTAPRPEPHAGHDVANLISRRAGGTSVGRRVCLDCEAILGPLVRCGRPTTQGRPCRVPVRIDLGYTTCRSHGTGTEGRDRAGAPRRRAVGGMRCRR
jgi:hypothetical protein